MRSRVLVGLSALALVGTAFISPAAAAPASVDAVTAAALLGATTNVPAADAPDPAAALQGDPIPDLADAIKKAKTDRENLVTQTERQEAAERSGITAPDISKAQLAAFARTQAALQGSAGGQKATTKAVTATADPHYFGPYANYANSPQHLPTALVTFAPPPAGPGAHTALGTAVVNEAGSVTGVTITDPGAGYLDAPAVSFASVGSAGSGAAATAVLNGTLDNLTITNPGSGYSSPVVVFTGGGLPDGSPDHAAATATIGIDGVITALNITKYGSGYTSAPTVEITSSAPGYTPAEVVATVTSAVASVTVTSGGAGYVTPGIRKFVDGLAGLGAGGANNLGQFIPVAVPDTTTYPGADYYEIGVVQYREKLHSDLPATLLRGYVQLSTAVVPGGQVALSNAFVSGPDEAIVGYRGVTAPHYLGPVISSTKDRPVRVLFRNLLPEGVKGDLFLPVDTTVMGAGQGPALTPTAQNNWGMGLDPQLPECGQTPKPASCFTENRAVAHLHGGATPWISDGTPHQWTTPAGDTTVYPEGVSVKNVPDMPDPGPGAQTFFYTNQQSARMLFYHDHAWGITRLNVYAGLAAGYLITDDTEKALIADGTIPGANDTIPLIVEDKTFVPTDAELAVEDPTWNSAKWGGIGSLWLPHVYMTAQNPYDVSGVNQFGRWAFGPWFWPPTNSVTFPPIANPWAPVGSFPGAECDPNTQECDPAAWSQIPATPTPSMGMEAFADTPVINGTVYPKVTLEPKSYRFRVLNAANDRFFNLSLYEASGTGCNPTTGSHCTEVALNPAEVAAAKTDPIAFPTPIAKAGPDWVQIATESGFLANPAVIPAQPITWVTDPTVFNAGNVDKHSLLVGPAERADVVVDFSKWAGKTLILYNDAPAAFPARDPRYDYYTDDADLRDTGGANTTPEGYGPNTRTIMQITIAGTPAPAFNTTKLNKAFAATSLGGGGVFEKSQHPIVVGQAAYNEAYDTSFGNAPFDGYARITDSTLTFHTLTGASDTNEGATVTMNLGPKAMHDEMGASWDNMFGRMSGNLGLEMPNNQPGQLQNLVLYPYVNPPTETFLGEALPAGTRAVPIVELDDGTQIWKITHNGVDTHPIHFHFSDVQVVNRVGWDGIIRPPDPNEIGWKDTVRISPLEDTIVAMRPLLPQTQFGIEQSKRPLNPSLPIGSGEDFINIQPPPQAQSPTLPLPTPWTLPLTNAVVNLDWEYVWHCHILSHEEMDMMRPLTVSVPVTIPDASEAAATSGGGVALSWTDPTPTTLRSTWGNPKNEVGYDIQRAPYSGAVVGTWAPLANATALANATTYTDATGAADTFAYKVVSWNAAGEIESNAVVAGLPAPTGLHAVPTVGSSSVDFDWTAPGGTVTGYRLQRSATANGPWLPVVSNTGSTAVTASATVPKGTWFFRVAAFRGAGGNLVLGEYSGVDSATVGGPAGPQITELTPAFGPPGVRTTVTITGLNLAGATDVTFGGAPGAIQGSPTATSITVRTPAHTAGKVDVVVTTPDGEATLVDGFLFGTVTTPGVPRAVQGLRGVGLVAVSWAAPLSNGGRDISGYTARVYTAATGGSPVGTCTTTTGTSCQVTGLANGASFFVDVFATNVMGDGAANSPRVATTTATVPTMPQSVATGPADSAAVIAWLAPLNNGGTPVTGYVATLWTAPVGGTSAGSCTTSGALTCAIGGLTNGVTYYADVYSTNLVGTGAASSPRVSVVPAVQGGGGGGGAGGGGAGGGSGGSDGSAAGGGSAAGPGSTTPTSPVAPTVPNTPRPVPALPPWKFMPNPQEAQYLGGGVTVVSKVQAQGLARVIMHSPPTSSAAKAPVAPVKANKITRVKIVGIPITKRSTIVVKIRIQGKYVDLGSVRTNSSGVIVLPALRLVKPGDYLVSLASGGKTWYVTIRVK